MTDEPRSAHAQVAPTPPEATASDALPYPHWLLFGLGALCCAAWLGAVALGQGALASTLAHLPPWLRSALRVMLVLVVPTLTLCALHSPRLPARQHARAFYIVEALVMALVALPALQPYTASSIVISLPLRMPIMSLCVALAAVDPRVIERWRARRQHSIEQWWEPKEPKAATALVAVAGFCAVLLAVGLSQVFTAHCTGSHAIICGDPLLNILTFFVLCGYLVEVVFAGLLSAWLGYALGARIAQSDRWR